MSRPMLRTTALLVALALVGLTGCGQRMLMRNGMCGGGCGSGACGDCGPAGGHDACGPTGPCGPLRSGADFERTYRVPQGPLDHMGLTCGKGCGETYWGEWISDPPDACDPCDDCGNWVGERYCPEWMRYSRIVPWGWRNGCGSCGCGCGPVKSGCDTCGHPGPSGSCGCGGHGGHVSTYAGPMHAGHVSGGHVHRGGAGCKTCGH